VPPVCFHGLLVYGQCGGMIMFLIRCVTSKVMHCAQGFPGCNLRTPRNDERNHREAKFIHSMTPTL
jgi:hypothetical protein